MESRQLSSYIRMLHAVPNNPPVDVYMNGQVITTNLDYREFTPYMEVPSGAYRMRVFPAGTVQAPVLDTNLTLTAKRIYTLVLTGMPENINLFPVEDVIVLIAPGRVNLRFVHLSPNTPALDIKLPDGTVLFSNVGYRGVSSYISVSPGMYVFEATPAGTNSVILHVPNITLLPGRNYTIYAVGLSNGIPPLQVLIPLDGSSYIIIV